MFLRFILSGGGRLAMGWIRRFARTPFAGPASAMNWRGLVAFLGFETLFSFSVISVLFYMMILFIFIINWIAGHDSSRFIPFLTAPLVLPTDIYNMCFTESVSSYGWIHYLFMTYILIDIPHILSFSIQAQSLYEGLFVTDIDPNISIIWAISYFLGASSYLIYQAIVMPALSILFAPLTLIGNSIGMYVGYPSMLHVNVDMFIYLKQFMVDFYNQICLERAYLWTGLHPYHFSGFELYEDTAWGFCTEHHEQPEDSSSSGSIGTPTQQSALTDPDDIANRKAKFERMFDKYWMHEGEENPSLWERHREPGCDACEPFVVSNIVIDPLSTRISTIISSHPYLVGSLTTSVFYWVVKLGVMYITANPSPVV
jgi:hypothetical protein